MKGSKKIAKKRNSAFNEGVKACIKILQESHTTLEAEMRIYKLIK